MIILAVAIVGVISFISLQRELMPEMNFGIAVVSAAYDGAGPEEIETLVTKPLEGALGAVSDLKNISATSSSGSSLIVLEFNDGTDMNNATLKMRENIDLIKRVLPSGVEPRVFQIDMNSIETLSIGVTGDIDIVSLKTIIDDDIITRLEKIDGVGSVNGSGGKEREISVALLPDKLAGYGVTAAQIAGVLSAENVNVPGGVLRQGDLELQVRAVGEFESVAEIENLPIIIPSGGAIFLRDIAKVTDGFKKTSSYSIINGKEGITLAVMKQSSANTVDMAKKVIEEIESMRADYPHINFAVILDTSQFITSSIDSVWTTVIQAILLTFLVLLVFLGSFRSSLIVGVAIPISIVTTLALMYFLNMSLNMITLNALLICVGMMVDNSIVVIESVSRHIQAVGSPGGAADVKEACSIGAKEVGISVVGSTLTTVVVFVPVLFVQGLAGKMFGQLGLVLLFALAASLVVSLAFVPMACSKFLVTENRVVFKPLHNLWLKWDEFFEKFTASYGKLLKVSITHKKIVVLVFTALTLASASVVGFMGMEMNASMDEGYLVVDITTPKGSLLEETKAVTDVALQRIENVQDIDEIAVSVGGGGIASMFGGASANQSSVMIKLLPKEERGDINVIADKLRESIGSIAGAEVSVSDGSQSSGGVSFSIYGEDMTVLGETGDEIVKLISSLPNVRNAKSSLQEGSPQARVVIDRYKASLYGFQPSAIASAVHLAISGVTATTYKVDGDEIDVVVRYNPEKLNYMNDLENMTLASASGAVVPLAEIAEIVNEQGPASITKSNRKRYITISADIFDSDINSVSVAIQESLDNEYEFPDGYYYEFTGDYADMVESFTSLGFALLLGLLLVYMVIASQFESLAYPATILFSIPIAMTTGLMGVAATGNNISVVAIIGLILLMGIVVNNGIVLVDYINLKRKEGMATFDAILFAAPVRLRPILMTTITTVLGLAPMLFSNGDGAELQKPLGALIFVGLSVSTFVTLILIPTLYLILHNFRKNRVLKKAARLERKNQALNAH
jgi:HAE1 family hydrophobic/amphiphilic exporter-1